MPESQFTISHLNIKDIARIFSKIRLNPQSGCWEWTAKKAQGKYGMVRMGEKTVLVHRLLYAWLVGPLPFGCQKKHLDHLCDNPGCCNPAHVCLVTPRANIMRSNNAASLNAKKTECHNGHPFTPENTRMIPGGRCCVICTRKINRDSMRRRWADPVYRNEQLRRRQQRRDKRRQVGNK